MDGQMSLFGPKTDCLWYERSPFGDDLCEKYRIPLDNYGPCTCETCPYYYHFELPKGVNYGELRRALIS